MQSKLNSALAIKFTDSVPMKGFFKAFITAHDPKDELYNGGQPVLCVEQNNLIVNGARKIMAHLISETPTIYGPLNRFAIGGDNTLSTAEMLNPPPPTINDTDLTFTSNYFVVNAGDLDIYGHLKMQYIYPNSPNETSVQFNIFIQDSDANDVAGSPSSSPAVYVSAGLFLYFPISMTQILFASNNYPAMLKTSSRSFNFSWVIQF